MRDCSRDLDGEGEKNGIAWLEVRVCRLVGLNGVDGKSDGTDKSMSSFVSDCARGLVGGWYTKLDSDVDSKNESDLKPSIVLLSISWALAPYENGVKPLGGVVESQVC